MFLHFNTSVLPAWRRPDVFMQPQSQRMRLNLLLQFFKIPFYTSARQRDEGCVAIATTTSLEGCSASCETCEKVNTRAIAKANAWNGKCSKHLDLSCISTLIKALKKRTDGGQCGKVTHMNKNSTQELIHHFICRPPACVWLKAEGFQANATYDFRAMRVTASTHLHWFPWFQKIQLRWRAKHLIEKR